MAIHEAEKDANKCIELDPEFGKYKYKHDHLYIFVKKKKKNWPFKIIIINLFPSLFISLKIIIQ